MDVSARQLVHAIVLGVFLCMAATHANAVIYQNAITIDGVMNDWTSPNDIPGNSDQASTDGQGDAGSCPGSTDDDAYDNKEADTGTCVGVGSGAGRDLKTFAFTYDATNLYLYVERFASSTNVTDWWFYLDTDNDGGMETTDILYRVRWQGSNQTTDRETWVYTPTSPTGDPLVGLADGDGDGFTMQGSIGNSTSLGSVSGGAASGVAMETAIPWATICGSVGCGPISIGFHISSSNGTNLPNSIADNMSGPVSSGGGSGLVFLDLSIDKSVSATDVGTTVSEASGGAPTMTFTITVTNEGGGDATDVEVTDVLNSAFEFVSSDDGTYNPDIGDNIWNIDEILEGQSATLNIVVLPVGPSGNYTNIATITDLNEADTDASNDSATSATVTINNPDLRIVKSHAGDFADGYNGSYSILVSNQSGAGPHTGVVTVEDTLPGTGELGYVGYSGPGWTCTEPSTIQCTYGTSSTLLSPGSSLPALTIIVNADTGGGTATVSNSAEVQPATGMEESSTATAGDNVSTDSTYIDNNPTVTDISVSQSVDDNSPSVSVDIVTYTITVTNEGPLNATGVEIIDLLPSEVTLGTATYTVGTYTSSTGLWDIGSLSNGASATLTLQVTADTGSGGFSVVNNAYLSAIDQLDSNSANNTASVTITPVEENLTTSTKSVVDLNGGQVNPGDELRYTITLNETGGADATGVRVYDDAPSQTSSLEIICVVQVPDACDPGNNVSFLDLTNADFLDVRNLTVPANESIQIVFEVVVDASAAANSIVSNSAVIDYALPDVTVSSSSLTVVRGLAKTLYFHNQAVVANQFAPPSHGAFSGLSNRSLSRIPTTDTTAYTIPGGASATWLMDPGFFTDNTIEDRPGENVPLQLVMTRPTNGSKQASAQMYIDGNCDGAGGTLIASSGTHSVLSSTSAVETLPLSMIGGDEAITGSASGSDCIYITITNEQSGKDFSILPYSNGESKYSSVDLHVYSVINVDSVNVYDSADTGFATPLTAIEGGQDVVIRSVVSDPFGEFDITSVTIKVLDAGLTTVLPATEMVSTASEVADASPATRTFEYAYAWPTSPAGTWRIRIEGVEGKELVPLNVSSGPTYTVIPPQPEISVSKDIYASSDVTLTIPLGGGFVDSEKEFIYTITVTNSSTSGSASNIEIEDALSTAVALATDPWGNGTPFEFVDGATASGYNSAGGGLPDEGGGNASAWQYSIDSGGSFLEPGATPLVSGRDGAMTGYDGAVTDFRIIFPVLPATMDPGGASFTIKYKIHTY